jgi:hypothetical protein
MGSRRTAAPGISPRPAEADPVELVLELGGARVPLRV